MPILQQMFDAACEFHQLTGGPAVADSDVKDRGRVAGRPGVIHGMRHRNDLAEAAGAYKNIEDVMQQQADLVRPLVTLRPLAVIKG